MAAGLFRWPCPGRSGAPKPTCWLSRRDRDARRGRRQRRLVLRPGLFSAAQVVVFLDPEVASEIFGDPQTSWPTAPGARATAVPVDGDYRLSGRWRFASGCTHATWPRRARVVGPGATPPGPDGPPPRAPCSSRPPEHLEEAWDVSGLRGTGSHTMAVAEVFVPPGARRTWPATPAGRRRALPPALLALAAAGFGTVAMGIAGAPSTPSASWPGARRQGGQGPLGEDPLIQDRVARAEGQLRSVRALLREASRCGRRWREGTRSRTSSGPGSDSRRRTAATRRWGWLRWSTMRRGDRDLRERRVRPALPGRPRRDPADPVPRPALPGGGARPARAGAGGRLRVVAVGSGADP